MLAAVALLGEAFAALLTPEGLDVEVDYLVVAVVLGLAALTVEYPLTYVTSPLEH